MVDYVGEMTVQKSVSMDIADCLSFCSSCQYVCLVFITFAIVYNMSVCSIGERGGGGGRFWGVLFSPLSPPS